MREYRIITDSGSDISPELLERWQVPCVDLTFRFEPENIDYRRKDCAITEFYQKMRSGKVAKTSAANMEAIRRCFVPELEAGRDILYLGFSSSLSTSVNVAQIAARELQQEYPERKFFVLDTCCASAGLGFLLYLTLEQKKAGASLEEAAKFVQETKQQVCHWFTVDNLVYLKRGGRLSSAATLAGTLLQIKPVLHMSDEGKLTNVRKVRGRKQSIQDIARQYMETALDPQGSYFISHGDCIEDARLLEQLIFEKTRNKAKLITDIGPVIGAHSGPGTLALFYLGSKR